MLTEILIIGTNKPIMETIERLVNKNNLWNATIAFSGEDAFKLLSITKFSLVLLCTGIDNEMTLKKKILDVYPNLPVIEHYGGGSGLLFAEIYQGLLHRQKKTPDLN